MVLVLATGSLLYPHRTEPPFTLRTSPVMWRARSDARKRIGPAMSSAVATRPMGIEPTIFANSRRSRKGAADISVSTHPGATQLTVTPDGPSSDASDFVNAIIPPLDAA